MIQRIQSIYYLGAIICLVSIFLFPIVDHQLVKQPKVALEFTVKRDVWLLISWMLHLALGFMIFVTAFLYKRIKIQVKIGRFSIIGYLFLIAIWLMYFLLSKPILIASTISDIEIKHELSIGFYILMVGLVLLFLGNRAVKKDKKLLDSLNRLR